MKVFISRIQDENAVFRQLLESRGIQVTGVPLITLSASPFETIPPSDWVFFSSKNAVQFFFQHPAGQSLQGVKWAAIGPATADALAVCRPHIDFVGNGDPMETARLFDPLASSQTVLFPAARHSRDGVQRHLTTPAHCIRLEVYNNTPVPKPMLREEDILVFTSPSNVESYFSSHTLLTFQQVVAIGKSTFATLQSFGVERLRMAEAPTETAMAEAVLRF
jgi:uroporphyrinogen-III synthase